MNNRTMIYIICLLGVAVLWFFTSCKSKKDNSISNTAKSDKLSNGFVKKGDTIWFHDVALKNVDPNTFELVDDYFFKDKDRVYFYETYRVSQDYFTSKRKRYLPLENADSDSFISLGEGYAKDKSTAWYIDSEFKVDDLESMKVLNHHFVVDNKTAYLDRRPIAGSDGKTFELISEYYAKDSKRYYYCTPIDGEYAIRPVDCHYESFVVIDHPYAKDKTSVYYEGDQLAEVESSTFEFISSGYAKDSQHVYFRNLKVEKADPSTFSAFIENENSLGETVYAKDKLGIFINDKRFSEADIATFKILNEKYTIDKNGVYYRMKKVKNADPASFIVFPHFMGDADAEDKNQRYGEGKAVK
jgi:hypothetical protein